MIITDYHAFLKEKADFYADAEPNGPDSENSALHSVFQNSYMGIQNDLHKQVYKVLSIFIKNIERDKKACKKEKGRKTGDTRTFIKKKELEKLKRYRRYIREIIFESPSLNEHYKGDNLKLVYNQVINNPSSLPPQICPFTWDDVVEDGFYPHKNRLYTKFVGYARYQYPNGKEYTKKDQ